MAAIANLTVDQAATVQQSFEGTTWNVNHNLDTSSPIVAVYDENNFQIIPQGVRIVDGDNVQITFPTSATGSAVVAKGGHIVSGSIDADNISGFDAKVKTKLNLDGLFSGSGQVTLQGDVTGTAASSSIAGLDGGDI